MAPAACFAARAGRARRGSTAACTYRGGSTEGWSGSEQTSCTCCSKHPATKVAPQAGAPRASDPSPASHPPCTHRSLAALGRALALVAAGGLIAAARQNRNRHAGRRCVSTYEKACSSTSVCAQHRHFCCNAAVPPYPSLALPPAPRLRTWKAPLLPSLSPRCPTAQKRQHARRCGKRVPPPVAGRAPHASSTALPPRPPPVPPPPVPPLLLPAAGPPPPRLRQGPLLQGHPAALGRRQRAQHPGLPAAPAPQTAHPRRACAAAGRAPCRRPAGRQRGESRQSGAVTKGRQAGRGLPSCPAVHANPASLPASYRYQRGSPGEPAAWPSLPVCRQQA